MYKALQEVGETLEWPSACVATGIVGWVFLSAFQAETETVFHATVKVCELQEWEEVLEARIGALEGLPAAEQQR